MTTDLQPHPDLHTYKMPFVAMCSQNRIGVAMEYKLVTYNDGNCAFAFVGVGLDGKSWSTRTPRMVMNNETLRNLAQRDLI